VDIILSGLLWVSIGIVVAGCGIMSGAVDVRPTRQGAPSVELVSLAAPVVGWPLVLVAMARNAWIDVAKERSDDAQ
jgi:hypothetical protein